MAKQNNEARTVRERIDSCRSLTSTIQSGAADSYGYARGGYVERPFGAGRDMQSLAGALSQFDRSLDGYLDKKLEENIEQGAAEGFVRFSENSAENKNMQDHKKLFDNLNRIPLQPCMAGIHAVNSEQTETKRTPF